MPAFSSRLLIHQAVVELEAGECGLIVVRRRGFDPIYFCTDCVFSSYAFSDCQAEQLIRREGLKEVRCHWFRLARLFCQFCRLEGYSLGEITSEHEVQLGKVILCASTASERELFSPNDSM